MIEACPQSAFLRGQRYEYLEIESESSYDDIFSEVATKRDEVFVQEAWNTMNLFQPK